MTNPAVYIDRVIAAGQEIRAGLSTLGACLNQLVTVVNREHDAIKRSDLIEIEMIALDKDALGERISQTSIHIQRETAKIREAFGQEFPIVDNSAPTISLVAEWIEQLAGTQAGLKAQLLHHLSGEIRRDLDNLVAIKVNVNPKIEMNKYLISKLLNHHRASIRFWQEINEESSATYGITGTSKTQKQSSILRVKA